MVRTVDGVDGEEFKFKQVLVVRSDLKMSKGKTAVQVAHAALLAADEARRRWRRWWKGWIGEGQRKVVVKVPSLEELLRLKKEADLIGLPTSMVEDKGLTEVPPGTVTSIGIGPAPSGKVDAITGELPLL